MIRFSNSLGLFFNKNLISPDNIDHLVELLQKKIYKDYTADQTNIGGNFDSFAEATFILWVKTESKQRFSRVKELFETLNPKSFVVLH